MLTISGFWHLDRPSLHLWKYQTSKCVNKQNVFWSERNLSCFVSSAGDLIEYTERKSFHKIGLSSFECYNIYWQNCLKISVWEDLTKIKHSRSGPLVVTLAAALSQYLFNFLLHLLLLLPLSPKMKFPPKNILIDRIVWVISLRRFNENRPL